MSLCSFRPSSVTTGLSSASRSGPWAGGLEQGGGPFHGGSTEDGGTCLSRSDIPYHFMGQEGLVCSGREGLHSNLQLIFRPTVPHPRCPSATGSAQRLGAGAGLARGSVWICSGRSGFRLPGPRALSDRREEVLGSGRPCLSSTHTVKNSRKNVARLVLGALGSAFRKDHCGAGCREDSWALGLQGLEDVRLLAQSFVGSLPRPAP
jgi:hypothetical protein